MSPDFASLQLTLVDRFVELGLGSHAEGVHQLTNFQRRLGLGMPTDPPSRPAWCDLLDALASSNTHQSRVDIVMDALASAPPAVPEHIAAQWPTVGAFSIQVQGGVARTHFSSVDTDDQSPLHPAKLATRRRELYTVLGLARDRHPEIDEVAGGSWMYTTRSYASLFPVEHVAGAVVRRGRRTFRGMSHWGQFLNHRWDLRADLADEFRGRVRTWTGDDPCRLFPIQTLEVRSPVALFDGGPE